MLDFRCLVEKADIWLLELIERAGETAEDRKINFFLTYDDRSVVSAASDIGLEVVGPVLDRVVEACAPLSVMCRIASLEGVKRLLRGDPEIELCLRSSTEQIRARGSNPDTGLWQFDEDGGFTGVTGQNTLIGVLDTGIDWTHQAFWWRDENNKPFSKIAALWDLAHEPDATLNQTSPPNDMLGLNNKLKSYGTHWTSEDITDSLQFLHEQQKKYPKSFSEKKLLSAARARIKANSKAKSFCTHVDCNGHGTHVAAIAAALPHAKGLMTGPVIGVAPHAWIVGVNLLGSTEPSRRSKEYPSWFKGQAPPDPIPLTAAARYVCAVARKLGIIAPIINCSFGRETFHNSDSDYAAAIEQSINSLSPKPLVVAGVANEANKHRYARLTTSGSGVTEFEVALNDRRKTFYDMSFCDKTPDTNSFSLRLLIPTVPAMVDPAQPDERSLALPVKIEMFDGKGDWDLILKTQNLTGPLTDSIGVLESGINMFVSCDVEENFHNTKVSSKPLSVIDRYVINFEELSSSAASRKNVSFGKMKFRLRVHHPGATRIYLSTYTSMNRVDFIVSDKAGSPAKPVSGLFRPDPFKNEEVHLVNKTSCPKNILSVAAVDHHGCVADFSSRGPLINVVESAFSKAQPQAPDVAAPGVGIVAAKSSTMDGAGLGEKNANDTVSYNGTSMACPHVCGVAALILSKLPIDVDLLRGFIGDSTNCDVALPTKYEIQSKKRAARSKKSALPFGGTTSAEYRNAVGSGVINARKLYDNIRSLPGVVEL